jgi:DNA-binding NarL/FixJ family response regulator
VYGSRYLVLFPCKPEPQHSAPWAWVFASAAPARDVVYAAKNVHYRRPTKVDSVPRIHHKLRVTPLHAFVPFLSYHSTVKSVRSPKSSHGPQLVEAVQVRILVAESGPIQSQLLTRALRSRRNFRVFTVPLEAAALHSFMQANHTDVVLLSGNRLSHLSLLRWLHVSYPTAAPVVLVESYDRNLVVNAFRAGARGLFLFNHAPFRTLCKCISSVSKGQIWINSEQMHYVLDALSSVPALRVVNSSGKSLLTPREEQVVALVADGQSNREVAVELGLSEHTIKKYLLRIFDKLGISTRVELVLYAVSHGENRQAEWMAGGGA